MNKNKSLERLTEEHYENTKSRYFQTPMIEDIGEIGEITLSDGKESSPIRDKGIPNCLETPRNNTNKRLSIDVTISGNR